MTRGGAFGLDFGLESYEMPQASFHAKEVDIVPATTITKGEGGFSTYKIL